MGKSQGCKYGKTKQVSDMPGKLMCIEFSWNNPELE